MSMSTAAEQDAVGADHPMIRIATYNIESFGESRGAPPLEARIAVLRPRLVALGADVLCLQEVDASPGTAAGPRVLDALDRLLQGTPYAGFGRAVSAGPGGGPADRHNLVVLSRMPIEHSASVRHDITPPQSLTLPHFGIAGVVFDRPLLHVTIRLPGSRMLEVVNLHLRAPLAVLPEGMRSRASGWESGALWAEGYLLAALKRAGQALEARHLVDRILSRAQDALIAVCGDFNARSLELPVRLLSAAQHDTQTPGLAAAELVALADRVPAAHRFSVRYGEEAVLVDHILASRPLAAACRSMQIHNQALIEEASAERLGTAFLDSTHAPLIAAFDLG